MASKNYNGKQFSNFKNAESSLIRAIDKRTAKGEDRENVDSSFNNYTLTASGERVWSY